MICFVSNEILPGKRGGIGFYIEEAMSMLEREGMETCFLVSSEQVSPAETERHLRSVGIRGPVFGIADYAAGPMPGVAPREAFATSTYAVSYYVARALEDICARHPVELVEFLDWGGFGFVPVRLKRLAGRFAEQVLAVRVHGTAEKIRIAEDRRYGLVKPLIEYYAEGYAVRHADLLLTSTPSVLDEYTEFYGRDGPGMVSPLPVRKLTQAPLAMRPVKPPPCEVLFIGSCQRQKGPEVLVEAAVRLLRRGLEGVRFVLMGRDLPTSVRYGSYAEEIRRMVPPDLRGAFDLRFTYYGPEQLLDAARRCSFGVLPSRWEAFSLAAHELRWLGTPLVLSPLPPFKDCFVEGQDAAFYDGTPEGLADVMERLLTGEMRLEGRPEVESLYVGRRDFAEVYRRAVEQRPDPATAPPQRARITVAIAPAGAPSEREETVRSVLASEEVDVQLLVVDEEPAGGARDERVRYLGRARGGLPGALNLALDRVESPLVCFLRPGQAVAPDYFRRAAAALDRWPEVAYVSSFVGICPDGAVGREFIRTEAPYGLDPVLVTVEDRSGLAHAVVRTEALKQNELRFDEEMFALPEWELAWSLAEAGLEGEVLPEVLAFSTAAAQASGRPARWLEEYHLLQRMADRHPGLVRDHPGVLKAHLKPPSGERAETLTDAWLFNNYRGLRLIRVGLKKCLREGLRGVLAHAWSKLKLEASIRFRTRQRPRSRSRLAKGATRQEQTAEQAAGRGEVDVSVAICTFDRPELLRRTLEGLARETALTDSFEVLVVDNACTHETRRVAAEYAGRLPLRYLREERRGLSHARNAAWRAAAGRYVAYLDDDAVPEPGWLAAVLGEVRRHSPHVLTGPHRPDYLTPRPAWFPEDYERWDLGEEARELRPDEHAIGVNLIVRRDALAAVGGFRADLGMTGGRLGFGEEVDLQARIRRAVPHARLRYCPDAAVRHAVRAEQMTLGWQLRRCVRYGLQAASYHGAGAFGGGRPGALLRGIGHGLAAALNLLRCPLRSRRRHPHWRRFLLDRVLPHVRAALAYCGFALRPAPPRGQEP